MPSQEPNGHPVQFAPSPWTTRSECYWLFHTMEKLPEGLYDPLEASSSQWSGKEAGEFKGGLGCIALVRYSETPVGPYDELLLIPGSFDIPRSANSQLKIPKKAFRICRIYVSQRATTYNGRLLWNIPKHLARFECSHPPTQAGSRPPEKLTIKVSPPGTVAGDGSGPFFSCTLQDFTWVPSVPFNTKYLPLTLKLAQPPLPQAPGHREAVMIETATDGQNTTQHSEDALLVGTNSWGMTTISSSAPRCRGCWVTVHAPGEEVEGSERAANQAAARHWPQGIKSWQVGAWLEDTKIVIDEPIQWKP